MPGCQLYRHFDCDGVLLYVGISLSTVARLCEHKHSSKWYAPRFDRDKILSFLAGDGK